MTKRKSIVCLTIAVLLVLILTAFCFWPKFEIGINDFISPFDSIKLGLDLKGGVYVTFEVETTEERQNEEGKTYVFDLLTGTAEDQALLRSRIEDTAKVMQDRLAQKGYKDAVVTPVDRNKIKVEIPNVDNEETIFKILNKPAELVVRMSNSETGDIAFDAKEIVSAKAYYDNSTSSSSGYIVQIELSSKGQKDISKATENCETTPSTIYFILDGTVISQSSVDKQMTERYCIVSGFSDFNAADNCAIQLSSGAYKLSLKTGENETNKVGAALGEKVIENAVISIVIGVVLIMIFLIVVYGMMGVAAAISILYYVVLTVLALAFLPFVQLTLPGIAGVILGFGAMIYGMIIILEHIKKDFATGKSRENAFRLGFGRSRSTVLDSCIAAFICGIALYIVGSAAVAGLAVTLMIGVVIAAAIDLLFLRVFLIWFNSLVSSDKLFALKIKAKGGDAA